MTRSSGIVIDGRPSAGRGDKIAQAIQRRGDERLSRPHCRPFNQKVNAIVALQDRDQLLAEARER